MNNGLDDKLNSILENFPEAEILKKRIPITLKDPVIGDINIGFINMPDNVESQISKTIQDRLDRFKNLPSIPITPATMESDNRKITLPCIPGARFYNGDGDNFPKFNISDSLENMTYDSSEYDLSVDIQRLSEIIDSDLSRRLHSAAVFTRPFAGAIAPANMGLGMPAMGIDELDFFKASAIKNKHNLEFVYIDSFIDDNSFGTKINRNIGLKFIDNFPKLESKYKFIDSNLKAPNITSPLDYNNIYKTMIKLNIVAQNALKDITNNDEIIKAKQKVISKYIADCNKKDNKLAEKWRKILLFKKEGHLEFYLSRFPNLNDFIETQNERMILENLLDKLVKNINS